MRGFAQPPDDLAVALYRVVLALYPPAFRRHFGGEMTIAFRDRARDAAHGGAAARVHFLVAMAADVLRSLAAEHVAGAFGTAHRTRRSASLFALTALAGVAIAALVCTYVVADAIVLRPIPYPHADRLVRLAGSPIVKESNAISERGFTRARRFASSFDALGAFDERSTQATLADGLPPLATARLYGDLLGALGAGAQLGRSLSAADAERGAAVLDGHAWRERFGADPAIVGRTLQIEGAPHRIVGVLDDAFVLPTGRVEVYVEQTTPAGADERWNVYETFGRLKAGAGSDAVARELMRTGTLSDGSRLTAVPLALGSTAMLRDVLVTALAVAAVLALLAMTLLATAFGRGTLRARAGATAIAVVGGVCTAALALGRLPEADDSTLPHIRALAIGGDLWPFLAALAGAAIIVIAAARPQFLRRARGAVTALACACALMLSGGALQAAGAWHDAVARAGGPGASDRTETIVLLDTARFGSEGAYRGFITALQRGLQAEPAFAHAAIGTGGPLGHAELSYRVKLQRAGGGELTAAYISAGPGFLPLVGLPVVRGRDIAAGDDRHHERVALIDPLFARRYFGSADPIGRTIVPPRRPAERLRVIGMIPSVRMHDVDRAPAPIIVEAIAQRPWPVVTVVTPGVADPERMQAETERVLAAVDPRVAGADTFTARRLVDDATARRRHVAVAATAGAVFAWLLAIGSLLTLPSRRLLRRRFANHST